MRKILSVAAAGILLSLSSCISFKQVGKLNMVSTRNVESKADYSSLRTYMGASKKELSKSRSETIEDAVDLTVKNTPGGEFLKNVKIYVVHHSISDKYYFAVEGDVWGLSENANYRGWKVGDKVQWKIVGKTYTGIITDLKNQKVCSVKADDGGKTQDLSYDKISKSE